MLIDRSGLDLSEQSPVACACLCLIIYAVLRASWRDGSNIMLALDWIVGLRSVNVLWHIELCGACAGDASLNPVFNSLLHLPTSA